jgi:hypothetical protein
MNARGVGRSAAAGLALAAALLTAGCGGDEQPSLSKEQLQTMAKDKLEAAAGAPARSVECPAGVESKVGATQRCVLTTTNGGRIGVTATVTKVDGDAVGFDVVADDRPLP